MLIHNFSLSHHLDSAHTLANLRVLAKRLIDETNMNGKAFPFEIFFDYEWVDEKLSIGSISDEVEKSLTPKNPRASSRKNNIEVLAFAEK